jgi:hypothetical protein
VLFIYWGWQLAFSSKESRLFPIECLWSNACLCLAEKQHNVVFRYSKQSATVSVGSVLKWRARPRRHAFGKLSSGVDEQHIRQYQSVLGYPKTPPVFELIDSCVVHLLRKTACLQRVFWVVHLQVKDTPSTEGIVAWRVISKQILLRPLLSVFDARRHRAFELKASCLPSRWTGY